MGPECRREQWVARGVPWGRGREANPYLQALKGECLWGAMMRFEKNYEQITLFMEAETNAG